MWSLFGALALAVQPLPPTQSPAPRPLAIVGVTVIVGDGQPPVSNATVVIDGRRILRIGAPGGTVPVPPDAARIDGRGKFLIPGLWDAHVHTAVYPVSGAGPDATVADNADYFFPLFVAHGVTSIRDVSGNIDQLRQWRTEIGSGLRIGPRLFITGRKVGSGEPIVPAGPTEFSSRAEKERLVGALIGRGADFAKVDALELDDLRELISVARARQLRVGGHIAPTVALSDAADAGLWTVEHMQGSLLGCSSVEAELLEEARSDRGFWGRLWVRLGLRDLGERDRGRNQRAIATQDPGVCDALARRLVAAQTRVVPTMVALAGIRGVRRPPPPEVDALVPPGVRGRGGEDRVASDYTRALDDAQRRIVARFHAAGVAVLTGTDLPGAGTGRVPGPSLVEELELLVEAGLTPLEALRAATEAPSRALGVGDSLGTVAPGMIADLVLLDRDPSVAIENVTSVSAVFLGGRHLPRVELDRMVTAVRARVAEWESASRASPRVR